MLSPQRVLACDPSKMGYVLMIGTRNVYFSLPLIRETGITNRNPRKESFYPAPFLQGTIILPNFFSPFHLPFLRPQSLPVPCQCDHAFFSIDANI